MTTWRAHFKNSSSYPNFVFFKKKQAKEDRTWAFKQEREKKEKLLRKEAFLKLAQDEERAKDQERLSLIAQLEQTESAEAAKSLIVQTLEQHKKEALAETGHPKLSRIQIASQLASERMSLEDEEELEVLLEDDELMADAFIDMYKDSFVVATHYIDPYVNFFPFLLSLIFSWLIPGTIERPSIWKWRDRR